MSIPWVGIVIPLIVFGFAGYLMIYLYRAYHER